MGDEMATANLRDKIFIATKLENPETNSSVRLPASRPQRLICCNYINARKLNQSLARFKEWKARGVCRYVGVTSTYHGDFPTIEATIPDW